MTVKVCAVQMKMTDNKEENINKGISMIKAAASKGANVILLSELFMGLYFCQRENYDYFNYAITKDDPIFDKFASLAKELNVVLPISFFEVSGPVYFNSLMMIDATGEKLGVYRKTHIPTGGTYQEKFYFTPGDTGFMVFNTKFGHIGIGICWDQWFLEQARILTLKGADIILYPTAIGSEEVLPYDSAKHWQNAMLGHSALNMIPIVASNRIGDERIMDSTMNFYGSSFMTDEFGNKVEEMDRVSEGFIIHEYDFKKVHENRRNWGIFRDRRVDMYKDILSMEKVSK